MLIFLVSKRKNTFKTSKEKVPLLADISRKQELPVHRSEELKSRHETRTNLGNKCSCFIYIQRYYLIVSLYISSRNVTANFMRVKKEGTRILP